MQDLQGKVAFITGGGSGIGLGLAHAFVDQGMRVVLADLRPDHLDAAVESFRAKNLDRNVHPILLDVTDRAAMAAAAEDTQRVFGKVHVLVNNAGVGIEGPLREATYSDWDFGLGVNLGGVINGLQTFLPRIRAHGEGGHVVNTASLAALVAMPASMAIYVASKAAVLALSESIRGDLAQDRIGVTVLCPGPVRSNIHELARNRPQRFAPNQAFKDAAEQLGHRQVSPLWMDPAEVGALIVKAIKNNELYVITHGEWRAATLQRNAEILAAMPEKNDPNLIASLRPPPDRGGGAAATSPLILTG
jgi:NAD(P)-dependent dehydrogenase (short-subunit alcohol dehydrogenase family)